MIHDQVPVDRLFVLNLEKLEADGMKFWTWGNLVDYLTKVYQPVFRRSGYDVVKNRIYLALNRNYIHPEASVREVW